MKLNYKIIINRFRSYNVAILITIKGNPIYVLPTFIIYHIPNIVKNKIKSNFSINWFRLKIDISIIKY